MKKLILLLLSIFVFDLVSAQEIVNRHYVSLRTNLLYDMALVPNIGFEYHVGSGWSVGGNCVFAWWKNEKKSFTQFATYDFGSDIKTCIGKQISTPHFDL